MGTPVPDETLPPSDRGERSETFSLGGGGDPRGIAKGCPLKTPRTPAALRQVSFIGGAAPSRPKSRPGGRLASKRFAAARSQDTTFSRLVARKCCCHPWRGKQQMAFALPLFAFPVLPANKFPPRWAWLGGHPGVWMQFHVRSILAPGTAPGRMACRFPFLKRGRANAICRSPLQG